MWPRLYIVPILNATKSTIDNLFRRTVQPQVGSVVYCDIAAGYAAHSGIYVEKNTIVHLHGSGRIEVATPREFMRRLGGWGTAISIYVSCHGLAPVGSTETAQRALSMVGQKFYYNMLTNNCHQFTAGCIMGYFNNSIVLLTQLKAVAKRHLGVDTWRIWDRRKRDAEQEVLLQ